MQNSETREQSRAPGTPLQLLPGIVLERMWEGGPLRQVSPIPRSGWLPHSRYGFAGRYVCDECREAVAGVYGPIGGTGNARWLCGGCREVQGPATNPLDLLRAK